MKDVVYQNKIQNAEQLWQLIFNAADIIRKTSNIFHQVRNNLLFRAKKCVKVTEKFLNIYIK